MKGKVSKNNIEARGKGARIKQYMGKNVIPVKLIDGRKRFMAAQTEDGKLVTDPQGNYIPYAAITAPTA